MKTLQDKLEDLMDNPFSWANMLYYTAFAVFFKVFIVN